MSNLNRIKSLYLGLIVAVLAIIALTGMQGCGAIVGGNVYSEGYRDGYIVGVTGKRQGFGGVSYVGEIKVSGHGFGGMAVDPDKPGQGKLGAWSANFYKPELMPELNLIRGDQLCRFYYKERDIVFSGGTNYEIERVAVLPPAGELKILNPEPAKDIGGP